MKTYELTYIIAPDTNSEQIDSKEKEIEGSIQTREGVIVKQSKATAKTLAYSIGGFSSGFFGIIEFQIDEEKFLEVKDGLNKDKKIIRNIVVVKEPGKVKKTRRSRKDEMPSILPEKKVEKTTMEKEVEKEIKTPAFEDTNDKTTEDPKGKVEIKDIEKELQDILGE